MVYFLYAMLLTALTIILAVGGLLLVRKKVHPDFLKEHHDVADPMLSIIGTLFAVLLGFMVANAMQRFEEARVTTQQEASAVANVYRVATGLPEPTRSKLMQAAKTYVQDVINDEWPKLARKVTSEKAWSSYNEMWNVCVHYTPKENGDNNLHSSIMSYMGTVGDSRRMRVGALHNGLPRDLWIVLLAGGCATITFTYFFGIQNLRLQILMTSMVSLAICLNMFLLFSFDDPFSGDVMVQPACFQNVLENFEAIEHPGLPFLRDNTAK
jgi:cytochrome bd-type quinol oxidase subunit 2